MNKLLTGAAEAVGHAAKIVVSRTGKIAERMFLPVMRIALERNELEKLDIPTLYKILEEQAAESAGPVQTVQESVKGQIAFLYEISRAIASVRGKNLHHMDANKIIKDCEEGFLDRMKTMGMEVHYESEVSPEEIAKKPSLILATHQGGGWENYLAQAITGIECGIVAKGELMKMPFIGDGLRSKKAIGVDRKMLNNPKKRRIEIDRIAAGLVQHLEAGENMLVFFEGTRSDDGEIAATKGRKAWANDLLAAVDRIWAEKTSSKDFQKLLLVFHTMTAMPDVPEKDFFLSRFRLGSALGAKLVKADGLKTKDSSDLYDPTTLFGKARSELKDMLIRLILKHDGKHSADK